MKKLDFKKILKEFGLPRLLIILGCGLAILLLSVPGLFSSDSSSKVNSIQTNEKSQDIQKYSSTEEYVCTQENRLKQILMQVRNLGKVEVMITVKSSKELVPLKDETSDRQTTTEQDSAGGNRNSTSDSSQEETVLSQANQGDNTPYIVKQIEPEIEGVLVIAQGGESDRVKSEIVDAVMVLFNVPAHKIKVMKMN